MTAGPDLGARIGDLVRQDRGRLLSALISRLGDFELAEEALSDALESALVHWGRSGWPDNPRGWLIKVARRKAIDRIRKTARHRLRGADLERLALEDEMEANTQAPDIPDRRLALIFTCCHPALDEKSRVALTLRTLGGLSTAEIARAFLDKDATMGQRLSRARSKIATAGIPFRVPGPEDWPERLGSVLAVVYLIFNEGHVASSGTDLLRRELCDEAIFLARLLDRLRPDEPEILGLLSLLLTTHARRDARCDANGATVPLPEQDRRLWNTPLIAEGTRLLDRAMRLQAPGPFQVKAAISALHGAAKSAGETDWLQILLLYDRLLEFEPTPVVRLNRAVALAETGALARALDEIAALAPMLSGYQPLAATEAALLARAGRRDAALAAYDRAIALTGNRADRDFLTRRRRALPN